MIDVEHEAQLSIEIIIHNLRNHSLQVLVPHNNQWSVLLTTILHHHQHHEVRYSSSPRRRRCREH